MVVPLGFSFHWFSFHWFSFHWFSFHWFSFHFACGLCLMFFPEQTESRQ
jgi:hypothetical protein